MPCDIKISFLKNEFGDNNIDSELISAENSAIRVTEMLNGCMCCVLVGQMKNAIVEMMAVQPRPDRIIIETSGSAFPAPIAIQIREIKGVRLDAIITVVDCVNFTGYVDSSYTAKLQAQYTDMILLNKHELVNEDQIERVIDYVNDLNTDTPKLKWGMNVGVDLVFGIDTNLGLENKFMDSKRDIDHHNREIDLIHLRQDSIAWDAALELKFIGFIKSLSSETVYRIKGMLPQDNEGKSRVMNWAFGRYILTPLTSNVESSFRITIMGVGLSDISHRIHLLFPELVVKYSPAIQLISVNLRQ